MCIIRYDTIEEFNVDSKAELQLNLAHTRCFFYQIISSDIWLFCIWPIFRYFCHASTCEARQWYRNSTRSSGSPIILVFSLEILRQDHTVWSSNQDGWLWNWEELPSWLALLPHSTNDVIKHYRLSHVDRALLVVRVLWHNWRSMDSDRLYTCIQSTITATVCVIAYTLTNRMVERSWE